MPKPPTQPKTPFERFQEATRHIPSVPKKTIPKKRPSSNRSGNR